MEEKIIEKSRGEEYREEKIQGRVEEKNIGRSRREDTRKSGREEHRKERMSIL